MIAISESDLARIAAALAAVKASRAYVDNALAKHRHRVVELEKIITSIQVQTK